MHYTKIIDLNHFRLFKEECHSNNHFQNIATPLYYQKMSKGKKMMLLGRLIHPNKESCYLKWFVIANMSYQMHCLLHYPIAIIIYVLPFTSRPQVLLYGLFVGGVLFLVVGHVIEYKQGKKRVKDNQVYTDSIANGSFNVQKSDKIVYTLPLL